MLKGRHIIVTGSSSGIGRSISNLLIELGAVVIGVCRNSKQEKLNDKNFFFYPIDISEQKNIQQNFSKILKEHPKVDGLVSNAGYGLFNNLEQFSVSQISNYISTNLISHILISSVILPHLKKLNRGDIIFIGSEAAITGNKKGSLYCAAKFGLRGFSQALRQESYDKNVRISIVNPGIVRTPFFDSLTFEPESDSTNAIEPQDVAEMVAHIFSTRLGTVIDEVNLSPLKKSLRFKKSND